MILLTTLTIVSFSIVSYNNAKTQVVLVANPISKQISEMNSITQLSRYIDNKSGNTVQISVISSKHIVLYDTNLAQLRNKDLSYLDIWDIIEEENTYSMIDAPYSSDKDRMFTYYTKVENDIAEDGYYYVRFSTNTLIGSAPFWILVLTEVAFIILLLGVMVLILRGNIVSSLEPLYQVQALLKDVKDEKYDKDKVVVYKDKNSDINNMLEEIDLIANNISKTMENLKEEQIKSKTLLQYISQGILGVNSKGEVLLANEQIKSILGMEDVIGNNINQLLPKEKAENMLSSITQDSNYTKTEISLNGKEYRIEFVYNQKEEDLNDLYCLIIVTDITVEYNENKYRSEFFANASHELKTPLTAITGYSDFLNTGEANSKQIKKCSQEIYQSALRMKSLIDQMLLLSKLDANIALMGSEDEFEIEQIVKEIISELEFTAKKHNISIKTKGNAKIVCNFNLLKTALKNIVSNAIKYNKEKGYVKIDIKEGDNIIITIKDSGIGMSSEDKDRVFDRFYKAANSKTILEEESSTGLGLSIVKSIINSYKGEIKVESALNKGTTFIITLPKKTKEID